MAAAAGGEEGAGLRRPQRSSQKGKREKSRRLLTCLAAPSSAAAAGRGLQNKPLYRSHGPPPAAAPRPRASARPAAFPPPPPRLLSAAIFVATLATEGLTHLGTAGPWLVVRGQLSSSGGHPLCHPRLLLPPPPPPAAPARPVQPGSLVPGEDGSRVRAGRGGRGGGGSCGGSLPPGRDHHLISTGNDMANGREGRSGAEPGDPPNPEEEGKQRGWRAGGFQAQPRRRESAFPPSPNAPPRPPLVFPLAPSPGSPTPPLFSPPFSGFSRVAAEKASDPEIAQRPQQNASAPATCPQVLGFLKKKNKNPIF